MEKPVRFDCAGKILYGILHLPADQAETEDIVVMVVGGPQTRVGSHRSYVQIARALCDCGIAVLRFDYEGLGDSGGEFVGFEFAAPSIRSALDFVYETLPRLSSTIIWSICDGATASAIYSATDRSRIGALILCNPFVETEKSKARTILRYYYRRRLLDKELWKKILSFRFNPINSANSFLSLIRTAFRETNGRNTEGYVEPNVALIDQIVEGVSEFGGPIKLLLSTNDLTAMEFRDLAMSRGKFQDLVKSGKICIRYIEGADHTFSSKLHKSMVINEILLALREFRSQYAAEAEC